MRTVHIAPVAQVRLARVIPSMHVHLCVASWLFSLHLSCLLLRPTVLLPALPDVHLRVQREVQVQPPVRLPLGDRGHFCPRDTPHRKWTGGRHGIIAGSTTARLTRILRLTEQRRRARSKPSTQKAAIAHERRKLAEEAIPAAKPALVVLGCEEESLPRRCLRSRQQLRVRKRTRAI